MSELVPPFAPRRPHELVAFGDVRVDDYYWLRERDNPEVIKYLEAENAYTEAMLEPLQDLRQQLFDTIKAADERGRHVARRCRCAAGSTTAARTRGRSTPTRAAAPRGGGDETVLIDRNAMAEGHDYLSCIGPRISPNDSSACTPPISTAPRATRSGSATSTPVEDLPDSCPNSTAACAWVTDDVFVYVVLDDAHRPVPSEAPRRGHRRRRTTR